MDRFIPVSGPVLIAGADVTGTMMQTSNGPYVLASDALPRIADLEKACETRARQIKSITAWLDEHQPDVWRRGIWDALNAAVKPPQLPEKQQ